MVRLFGLILLVSSLGLTGCQNAKMSTATKKPAYSGNNGYVPPRPPPGRYQQAPPYYPSPNTGAQENGTGAIIPARYQEEEPVDTFEVTPSTPVTSNDYVGELNPLAQTGDRPQLEHENITEYFDFRKIPRLLDTCRENCALPEPPPTEVCHEGDACAEPPKPIIGMCAPIKLKGKAKAQKVDILFVVDTSKSMRSKKKETGTSELEDMAAQMKSFIGQLDPEADYNIGVLLAHSPATPKSPHNFFGKLYSKGNGDSEVLSLGKLIAEGKSKGLSESSARQKAEEKIVSSLKQKFANLATDKAAIDRNDAYGEVGLLSLYHAVSDSHALRDLQGSGRRDEGLMRDGAALNVIFVSDENDACYNYEAVGIEPRVKDPKEVSTYNSICKEGGPNGRLIEDDVLEALRKAKGQDKVILSAVIYTNEATLPKLGPNDENDIGHGYKELVEKAHGNQNIDKGALADLASGDFGKILGQIGKFTQAEMNYTYKFTCESNVDPAKNMKPSSFDMIIRQGAKQLGRFHSGCGFYSNKEKKVVTGTCPAGAYPIKPGTKKGDTSKVVLYLESDDNQRGRDSREAMNSIQDKIGEGEAIIEISFEKNNEDGISNIEQLQILKQQIPLQNRTSKAVREEKEEDDSTKTDGAADGAANGSGADLYGVPYQGYAQLKKSSPVTETAPAKAAPANNEALRTRGVTAPVTTGTAEVKAPAAAKTGGSEDLEVKPPTAVPAKEEVPAVGEGSTSKKKPVAAKSSDTDESAQAKRLARSKQDSEEVKATFLAKKQTQEEAISAYDRMIKIQKEKEPAKVAVGTTNPTVTVKPNLKSGPPTAAERMQRIREEKEGGKPMGTSLGIVTGKMTGTVVTKPDNKPANKQSTFSPAVFLKSIFSRDEKGDHAPTKSNRATAKLEGQDSKELNAFQRNQNRIAEEKGTIPVPYPRSTSKAEQKSKGTSGGLSFLAKIFNSNSEDRRKQSRQSPVTQRQSPKQATEQISRKNVPAADVTKKTAAPATKNKVKADAQVEQNRRKVGVKTGEQGTKVKSGVKSQPRQNQKVKTPEADVKPSAVKPSAVKPSAVKPIDVNPPARTTTPPKANVEPAPIEVKPPASKPVDVQPTVVKPPQDTAAPSEPTPTPEEIKRRLLPGRIFAPPAPPTED